MRQIMEVTAFLTDVETEALVRQLASDPFVQSYNDRQLAHTSPAWAIGEQRGLACVLLGESLEKVDESSGIIRYLAYVLLSARTYLWNWEIWRAASQLPIPEGAAVFHREDFKVPQFWTWDRGCFCTGGDLQSQLIGPLIFEAEAGPIVVFFPMRKVTEYQSSCALSYGESVTEKDKDTLPIIAAQAFLRSPYVPAEDRSAPRPMRRTSVFETPPVRVIALRESLHREISSAQSETKTEWSCRWLVSGHLRNQWYPSASDHRLIYVPPYVKGPSDKPLRAPRPVVRAVSR